VRCEAYLVSSGLYPLRQFTDEMANEHMRLLDAWH